MFNVSGPELLVVLLVALIVLGPEKLPEMARKIGNITAELRRISNGFQAEVRDAFQEPMQGFRDVYNGTATEAPPATPAIEATASEAAPAEAVEAVPAVDATDVAKAAEAVDVATGASRPGTAEPVAPQDHVAQPELPLTDAIADAPPVLQQPDLPASSAPAPSEPAAHRPPDPTPWSG